MRTPGNLALITAWNILKVMQFIESHAKNLKIPMLILQGRKDIVTNCDGCVKFFDNCINIKKDKEMKIYEDSGHPLWMEEPKMINDVNQWIAKYL